MFEKISDDDLKKLHQVQVEILDEIARVCDELEIDYFLAGGTLLGAIRHNGFIPWDDDLDLIMLRKDYDLFLKKAPKFLNEKYTLQCYETDKKCYFPFAKVRKNNTIFEEAEIEKIDVNKGIFVDIFPAETIKNPNSKKMRIDAMLIKNIWETIFFKTKIYCSIKETRHPFITAVLNLFSLSYLKKKQIKLLKKQNTENGKYLSILVGAYDYRKDTYEKNKLLPSKKVIFEGKKYKAFADPDYYLRTLYGDYMTLPPVEKRVNHAPKRIVFDVKEEEEI